MTVLHKEVVLGWLQIQFNACVNTMNTSKYMTCVQIIFMSIFMHLSVEYVQSLWIIDGFKNLLTPCNFIK